MEVHYCLQKLSQIIRNIFKKNTACTVARNTMNISQVKNSITATIDGLVNCSFFQAENNFFAMSRTNSLKSTTSCQKNWIMLYKTTLSAIIICRLIIM